LKVLRKAKASNIHHWAASSLQAEKIKEEKCKKNMQAKQKTSKELL
jgi:hypothetical protein